MEVQQYYEPPGVPMVVPVRPAEVADAWTRHRARLRSWLRDLPTSAWDQPTRCEAWDVSALVQHLISGSQFLGFTLHQARKGVATRLLAGFDPQATPAAAASQFAALSGRDLVDVLEDIDGRVQQELDGSRGDDWLAPAEAPLGRVPAFVSVNHFLFDSWVHERDLMLPAGEMPTVEPLEIAAVAPYVVALAGCAAAAGKHSRQRPSSFGVIATDVDLHCSAVLDGGRIVVTIDDDRPHHLAVAGPAADIVDFATGRHAGDRLIGDSEVTALLHNLAVGLA